MNVAGAVSAPLHCYLHIFLHHPPSSLSMLARAVNRLPAALQRSSACKVHILRRATLPATSILPCSLRPSSSSSSSTRWKARQGKDAYARSAKLSGLKSRAAFKLLEINDKYRLFHRGDTVVDLGFAPGSWSQVAVSKTSPGGRVVGIDVIPAQPPRGANALQGNFLSPEIREEVRKFVSDPGRGRARTRGLAEGDELEGSGVVEMVEHAGEEEVGLGNVGPHNEPGRVDEDSPDYGSDQVALRNGKKGRTKSQEEFDLAEGRVVNVVLSDMMLNTSGIAARDHGGSMDLCMAALIFCYDTLATGGHFLCKFYTGAEDHDMELKLKKLFEKVHRIKPDATRKESKEAYFVGLRRRAGLSKEEVFNEA